MTRSAKKLDLTQLSRKSDLSALEFETTNELEPFPGILGQPRAVAAVEFGIRIDRDGFNIFAFGPTGSGKYSAVQQYLEEKAASEEVPPDICYVSNFEDSQRPRKLHLPPGRGPELRRAMDRFIDEMGTALEAALESEQYQTQKQVLEEHLEERQSKALSELGEEAGESGLALLRTPVGIVFAPIRGDEVLSPDEFNKLPDEERARLEDAIEHFKDKVEVV